MVLNNWVGFFTCLKKKPQKFLWWSRRMLMDGAMHFYCESWVKGVTGS